MNLRRFSRPASPAGRPLVLASLLALVLALPVGVLGAGPEAGEEPSGGFFRDWLLCGPFPLTAEGGGNLDEIRLPGWSADFLASAGGESAAHPRAGEQAGPPGGKAVWTAHRSAGDAIDLDAALSKVDGVVGYAYREVVAVRERVCLLAVGSNDGVRVWWNGEAVLDAPGPRGLKVDHNVVPVVLRAGINRLLLKVEERGNRWGFACRLLPLGHEALPMERLGLFEVVGRPEAAPVLVLRGPSVVVRAAHFEAFAVAEPEAVLWRGEWAGEREMPIDVPSRWFGSYGLRVRAELAEGIRFQGTLPFTSGPRVQQVLFDGGRSSYRIVVDPRASDAERWAAAELGRWVAEVGGVTLPVVETDAPVADGREILVGWSARVRDLAGEASGEPAKEDESYQVRSFGPTVAIWGGRQRGTMYGVMAFLEEELGVRFYTPSVTVAPKRSRHTWLGVHRTGKPGVRVRNDFYHEAFDPVWAARNRVNGAMSPRSQPGGVEAYWSVHTFYPLVPPSEFFAEHPEYYSLIDGVRTHDRAQLCLSQAGVLRIVIERLRKRMQENPEYLIYDVSQNDWANPCQCRECQAIVAREGSESGPVLQFVNQVADALREEFPGKYVGTLAYQYTRKPPRTLRPRENVVVRFCSIECCFAHPFVECPENRSFVEDMDGWAAIAPHLYIWDYVVNFSHYVMPYPNFRALAPNLRFFRDHRAIGIMEQGAYQSRGGEFAELRAWVLAKLLWDPEAEVASLVGDFLHGYYGRAGQFLQAYFDLLHGRITPDTHIHLGLQHDDRLFSDAFVDQAGLLFDQAERVADNEDIRRRVEMARLPLLYLQCKRHPALARQDGTYARFQEIARREGVTHYAEAGEPHRRAFHAEVEAAR